MCYSFHLPLRVRAPPSTSRRYILVDLARRVQSTAQLQALSRPTSPSCRAPRSRRSSAVQSVCLCARAFMRERFIAKAKTKERGDCTHSRPARHRTANLSLIYIYRGHFGRGGRKYWIRLEWSTQLDQEHVNFPQREQSNGFEGTTIYLSPGPGPRSGARNLWEMALSLK